MGRNGRKRLDQLIDEVARGERQLSSISDPKLREAVRLALRLHDDAPVAPDAYAKRRMRARVMVGLEPHRPTLLDNAWTALELLARPAPYIVRGVAISVVIACLGMSTIVASADTLPDDLLYPVKLATEQVRLALADAPGDRASVELSIAAHRLSEAEQLATNGRTSDALVATALYSQHVATAAAELASQSEASDLDAQLQAAFNAQRDRAQFLAVTLAADVKSARGAQILAMIASPTYAPGQTKIEQVAIAAASVAQQLAIAAGQAAAENEAIATPPPSGTPGGSPTAPVVTAPTAAARATTRATPTATDSSSAPSAAAAQTAAATSSSSAAPSASGASSATTATTATTASPAASASAAVSTPAASASGPAASGAAPTTVANTTTTVTTTTTTTTSAPPPGVRSPEAKVTHDPRANDAAKAAKDAAEKAKAAADKLREALRERESKQKGK
ncbi:MAG: hypothetical protein AUH85_09140 [Chloroflexi bacterium 13_1_40CM_4_68_4]|nr:MAG: hypothetical protein AUH85_09140 [Chloroflexi bacterium 13_1_40CM_4_68_4]